MISTTADELPRLMQCIGSRDMAAVMPPDFNREARDEGTAAHEMAQRAFSGDDLTNMIDQKASNGHVMTAEMADHVSEYLKSLDCGEMECDTSFAQPSWEIRGRADHIKYHLPNYYPGNVLVVDDFKYGYRIVEPRNNWTLIAHAIGYCLKFGVTPAQIILRIHQPRAHHPDGRLREWCIDYGQLTALYVEINQRLGEAGNDLTTGFACFKCHAFHTCPAAQIMQGNAIDATYETAFNDDLPLDVLASELKLLQHAKTVIEARCGAIEELASHKIKNGAVVPGYALEQRYTNRNWKKDLDAKTLSALSGINCVKETTITPSEFKRRKGSEAVLTAMTERFVTGVKLVQVNPTNHAERLLGKVK